MSIDYANAKGTLTRLINLADKDPVWLAAELAERGCKIVPLTSDEPIKIETNVDTEAVQAKPETQTAPKAPTQSVIAPLDEVETPKVAEETKVEAEPFDLLIKEAYHSKNQHKYYIVHPTAFVKKADAPNWWSEINKVAKAAKVGGTKDFGGHYSRKYTDPDTGEVTPNGWCFLTLQEASNFYHRGLKVDRTK